MATTEGNELSPESAVAAVEKAYLTMAPMLREVSEKKFRIPPADAEAVVNTVFEVYLRRRARVHDMQRYLIASVCNASRDYWRAKKKTDPLPEGIEDYLESPAGHAEERLVQSLSIAVTLARLGTRCCEALYLFHLGGYSAKDIAGKLNTSEQNAWQILSTCRRRARQLLGPLVGKTI
jgi:RNA polymerase sigma factor (sigma-70 family)